MKKKIIFVTLILAFIFVLTGCTPKEKIFDKKEFKITLTEEFEEDKLEGYNYYFTSKKSALTALKETFTDLEQIQINSESTLDDYANAVLKANNKEIEAKKEADFIYFTYDSVVQENKVFYLSVMKKGKDGFWLINFFGLYENKDTLEPEFLKYAKTINV